MRKLISGYKNFGTIKGFWKNKKDFTMNNNRGFIDSLEVIYIGKKEDNYKFDIKNIDKDESMDHSK